MTQTRRILINVLATYGRSLFSLACGIFTGRWVLEALGTTSYGVYGVVGTIIGLVTVVNKMLSSSVCRYFAYTVGKANAAGNSSDAINESMGWFNTAVAIHFSIPFALVLIGYPLGYWAIKCFFNIPPEIVPTALWVFTFSMITTFVSMALVPFQAIYTAHQYIAELTVYSVIQTAANVVCAWFLLSYNGDRLFFNALYLMLIAVFPQFVIALRAFVVFPECRIHPRMMLDRSRYKNLFSFAGWQIFSWIGFTLQSQGMVAVCNKALGLIYNSSLNVASTVAQHTMTFSFALNGAFAPAITNAAGANDKDLFNALVLRACKFSTIMCTVFIVPLCLEIHYVIHLWLKVVPPCVEYLCVLALVAHIIERMTSGYLNAISAHGDIRASSICAGIVYTVTFGFGCLFVFLFKWGVVGIGVASLISLTLQSFRNLVLAKYQLKMALRRWLVDFVIPFSAVIAITIVVGLAPRIFMSESFCRLIVVSALTALVFIASSMRFVCDARERIYLREQLVYKIPILRRFFK